MGTLPKNWLSSAICFSFHHFQEVVLDHKLRKRFAKSLYIYWGTIGNPKGD